MHVHVIVWKLLMQSLVFFPDKSGNNLKYAIILLMQIRVIHHLNLKRSTCICVHSNLCSHYQHTINKTLCFCKINKQDMLSAVLFSVYWSMSQKLSKTQHIDYLPNRHEKYIYRKLDMPTFRWTNSNRKQIFSDYVICNLHFCSWHTDSENTSLLINN